MARYTPCYRPPTTCNLPMGLRFELVEAPRVGTWRADLPVSEHLYGVIETAEPIPVAVAHHFDLRAL